MLTWGVALALAGLLQEETVTEVPPPSEDAWRTMAQLTKAERANLDRLKNEYLERMGR